MISLPPDLFRKKLHFLGIKDRFALCRVNRTWKDSIYSLPIEHGVNWWDLPDSLIAMKTIGPLLRNLYEDSWCDTPHFNAATPLQQQKMAGFITNLREFDFYELNKANTWSLTIYRVMHANQSTLEYVYCPSFRRGSYYEWFEGLFFPKVTKLTQMSWNCYSEEDKEWFETRLHIVFPNLHEIEIYIDYTVFIDRYEDFHQK